MALRDFNSRDYNYDSFSFRMTIASDPYKHGYFFGKYGLPKHFKYSVVTPGEFSYFMKICFWCGVLLFPIFVGVTYGDLFVDRRGLNVILTDVAFVAFIIYGMWVCYNFRRGYRAGFEARMQESADDA
jgi:hypothetical protein